MIGKTSEERSELLDSSTSPIHTRSLYFQMWPKSCSCLTELYNHANRLPARKVDREGASCCKFPRESVGCTKPITQRMEGKGFRKGLPDMSETASLWPALSCRPAEHGMPRVLVNVIPDRHTSHRRILRHWSCRGGRKLSH
jgi:hypothetical protein